MKKIERISIQLQNIFLFTIVLQFSCLTFSSSERFIFDNDKYSLIQYNFLYDEYNKIETDIYFFYNEKVNELLDDENVLINDTEERKYELCKSDINRYSLELIKIDLMMKYNESITNIISNNSNCYFFFNYDLVRFEKYSGNPRVSFFPFRPAYVYSEYSELTASYVDYNEIKNYRLVMYLDKKMEKDTFIKISTDRGKTYKYLLKKSSYLT